MSFFRTHIAKFAAPFQKFLPPSHQLAGAIHRDRRSPLLGGMLSRIGGPKTVLDPAGCAFDQPPIPRRTKCPCQTPMGLRPLCFPGLTVERPLFAGSLKSPDRDIEISHGAKLGAQPLQFGRDLLPLGVGNHRSEKRDSRAQASERNAHLMQRFGIASACRGLICRQIRKTATRHHPKSCVACHQGT